MNAYALYEKLGEEGFRSTAGRTAVSPVLSGEKLGVFICAGQSLAANHGVSLYAAASAQVQNLNPYDGLLYRMQDPALGCSWIAGCYWGRLGDRLIATGVFERVIFCPVAVGGTRVDEWAPTGAWHHRLIVAALRCRQLGLPVSGILWGQGEQDNYSGTSEAAYLAALQKTMRGAAGAGVPGPWFVAEESSRAGVAAPQILAAQRAAVDNVDVFSGPDMNALGPAYRQADNIHLNDAGAVAVADLWRDVLAARY